MKSTIGGAGLVVATLLSLLVSGRSARAHQLHLAFFGASETASFGLASSKEGYPAVVASTCRAAADINATAGLPISQRLPAPYAGADATVIFLTPFDAMTSTADGAFARWLHEFSGKPTLVLEAPILANLARRYPDVVQLQVALHRDLVAMARTDHLDLETLRVPQGPVAFLQQDGLHPNARGQRVIAALVVEWLHERSLCKH